MPWNQEVANRTKFVWARRNFTVTPTQAAGMAVLRWNRIACGAVAFVNGEKVGENEPTGPFHVVIPAGVLRPGDNHIVLKVRGAAGVPRSRSGNALIPAGFGVGMPEVTDDVWIDFADAAYMKWVLALPDLAGSRVKIRITPIGPNRLDDLTIVAQIRSWPDGMVLGSGHASARLMPTPDPLAGDHFFVEAPMPGFKAWTYEEPHLYTADVTLRQGDKVLDAVTIRFGMREITIANGHYLLNGKTLRLRGSELVFEWNWGDTVTGKEFDYLVTEAREMSMNAFRTHTMPLQSLWANISDENGTMILAEFPCLYNYQDYRFTPEEYAIWHKNVLSDAAGWMGRLWNHPAVVMWVLSNESNRDGEWETGPYHGFVRALDPTRPTMRTGDTGTAENYDVHTCGNVEDTLEGNLIPGIGSWFSEAKGRPVTNSEYMNYFGRPATQWTGKDDKDADALACAQIGMEHTEAMRLARLDGMLPYMYAGWTRTRLAARVRETGKGSAVWKAGYASPLSACWHSSLSPVLASLDLFDPDYLPGQDVRSDLYLINDSWHDAAIHVDLLLTEECPEFIPEAPCFDRPVTKWSYDFSLKADTLTKTPITWKLPDREGSYWLTARTTGIPGRAVLSQRFVRAVRPPEVPAALRARRFVVLGRDATADAWFKSRGLQTEHDPDELTPGQHVVVIWNAAHLTPAEKNHADVLREFAAAGGRVVVLATHEWDWTELCDLKVGDTRGSRAFLYPGTNHPILAGVQPEWLMRWNGLPGTVAAGSLDGPALEAGTKVLWVREPTTCVAAEVPVVGGKGTILFSQLDVQRHVDRSEPDCDPVAEKVLINTLQGTPRQDEHLADYDAELRRPDGRVDIDAMVTRLQELGVTTYYWLIWHAPTDWEDLKLFLPRAAKAGIQVWVYLVPPSESPPKYGSQYSEPFRLDYHRWAEEIAKMSLQHPNLTAWVIDDFYANHEFFTPAYLREMQARARRISPGLAFLPLMYFEEIRPKFVEDYREVIDGVVVAYLQDRDEIEWTWAILNDAAVVPPGELSYPWDAPSKAGDFAMAGQSVHVLPADRYIVAFRERDDFTGPTSGYHFKQLLVDGTVVWEEDVADGAFAWRKVTIDVTEHVRGKTGVTVALRLIDKKGVSNFGVRWHLSELRAENLQFVADPAEPGKWKVDCRGPFEAGFGNVAKSGERRFHIPFISMTAGDVHEFGQRHGDPATPERVAEWLRTSLQARQDGKCDGVVTYCLDKRPQSRTFPLARELFHGSRRPADRSRD